MKLRYIILATILLGVLLGVGVINLVSRYTILEYFRLLEEEKLQGDISRIQALIQNEIEQLDRTNADWAYWDDSYAFITGNSDDYVDSNLSVETLVGIRNSFILYYDLDGNLSADAWVDLDEESGVERPDWLSTWVRQNGLVFVNPVVNRERKGVIHTPDGYAMISVRAIRNTDGDLPARGSLIMGRYLTAQETERIAGLLNLPFELISLNNAGYSSDTAAIMNEISKKGHAVLQYYNDNLQNSYANRVKAYQYLYGINGLPVMLIAMEQERSMYEKGLEGILVFSLIVIGVGVMLGVGLSFLLHQIFTRRLEAMNSAVQRITSTKDLKLRVPVEQDDEITQLGRAINLMIEELDEAQKMAMRAERRFRSVLENLQMIAVMMDREGRITFCNQFLVELSGYEEAQILGKNWMNLFIPGEVREKQQEIFGKFIRKELKTLYGENEIQLQSGERRLIAWSNTILLDEQGEVSGIASIGQDITLQRLAEEALKESENTLQGILDAVPAGIGLVKDETMIWVSDRVEEISGYSPSELVGQTPGVFYENRETYDAVMKKLRSQLSKRTFGQVETQWLRKCGSLVEIDLRVSPINPQDWRQGSIVTALDITDKLEAEKRLRESFEQVKTLLARMSALRNIDELITSPKETADSLLQILHLIRETINLDTVLVSLFEPDHNLLQLRVTDGLPGTPDLNTNIPLDFPHIHQAIYERQSVHVAKLTNDDRAYLEKRLGCAICQEEYWVIPLIVKGAVLGVLEAFTGAQVTQNQDMPEALETMATQLAIALDNASLFQQRETAYQELQAAYEATIQGWALALEMRDKETEGHSKRVVDWTMRLAEKMGFPKEDFLHLRRGVVLHDIGKMSIPDSILLKEGPLDDDEWEIMKHHPVHAYELLKDIPYLAPALNIPYCHHERWNGSGYPQGLKGREIPLEARIFMVVDIWDALVNPRPYKPAWSITKTAAYLQQQAGILLDPDVVRAFLDILLEDGVVSEEVLESSTDFSTITD